MEKIKQIQEAIKSLKSFNEYCDERNKIRKQFPKNTPLGNWIIFGKILIDEFSQIQQFNILDENNHDIKTIENLPNVISMDDRKVYGIENCSYGFNGSVGIPKYYCKCPILQRGWTVENLYNNMVENEDIVFNMNDLIGATFGEFLTFIKFKSEVEGIEYWVRKDAIRNDKYIDLTPNKDYPTLSVNLRGWVEPLNTFKVAHFNADNKIGNDYIIQPGMKYQ